MATRSAGYKILIVEDDDDWLQIVRLWLETGGYRNVRFAQTGSQALKLLSEYTPDCIILDLRLGDQDGSQLCRRIRSFEATSKIPVIMFTSYEQEKVACLARGADYFIGKSPKGGELLATLNAVFRRRDLDSDILRKGDLAFQAERREVYLNGDLVAALTPKAYELFVTLVKRSPAPVSRKDLFDLIETKEDTLLSRGLEILMNRLRKALPAELRARIKAVRGFGYAYLHPSEKSAEKEQESSD